MTDTPENAPQAARFQVTGQYVKDLSFENPSAPNSLMALEEKPNINVNIDLNAQKLRDDLFEVAIKISASALVKDKKLFVTELEYAGLFTITGVPDDRIEPLLFVDCPFVLFPYARRIISDVTRDGGFPPLLLEPIDFFTLYKSRLEARAKAQGSAEAKNETVQ
ncbi:MAG: protein-export chaperone SecB [Alphaproteobacteria bacterium]|nr:protein-export chaperone SecB [Alphaproteobacteria bacterium]